MSNQPLRLALAFLLAVLFNIPVFAIQNKESKQEAENGKDYPTWIDNETVVEYPDEFFGAYERMRFMHTTDNVLLDRIISTVNTTDYKSILGIKKDFVNFLHIYVLNEPFPDNPYINTPQLESNLLKHTIDIANAKYLEFYVVGGEKIDICSKYCFVYQSWLMFSEQWIDGLFENINAYLKLILGGLQIGEEHIVWRFVVENGEIKDSSV